MAHRKKSVETFTHKHVVARVKEVRQYGEVLRDDEKAHAAEDQLWEDTLFAIAMGAENPVKLAKEALKTRQIKFSRWCA